jgi:acetolactate synthase-1/2/3 large subunit
MQAAMRGTRMMRTFHVLHKHARYFSSYVGEAHTYQNVDPSKFVGMTGAQIFHEMMVQHNVKQVFGYPGGAILPVFDAIYNSKNFNFVLPRHEQGGGHMAEGYARASGKPGVLLVTSGPGATNTVTPLQDALMDGVPIIVFSGQVATPVLGTDAFQEADVVGITKSCTKWNTIVKDVKDLPRRINEAFIIATTGRPGPVLVDLPKDVTAGVLNELPNIVPQIPEHLKPPTCSNLERKLTTEDFKRIATLINNAKRPVIYAGHGIVTSGTDDILKQIAEKGNIPVTTTIQGLGGFNELSPLSLHMLGMHGSAYANYAMQHADVIIALGARFDDRVTGVVSKFAPEAMKAAKEGRGGIIHFDIYPRNVNKIVKVHEPVLGDLKDNLGQLLPHITHNPRTEWLKEVTEWKNKHPFVYSPAHHLGALKPQAVLEELNRQLEGKRDNIIITTGVGQHQMWAAQYIRWTTPRSFLTSGGLGTMGFGLPSAIGAKVACPNKIVIDVDGDASLVMTAMEMITAVQYNIGVKVLLLNNNFLGMVKQWQDLFYDERYSQTEMFNPNFVKLAEAVGAKGLEVSKEADLKRIIAEFLAHDGPVLLNATVEKDEHVFPMVPSGRGLGEMVFESEKQTGPPPS